MLIRRTPLGRVAYVGRGPAVDWTDGCAVGAIFEAVHELARREGCCFLQIEPNWRAPLDLGPHGFRPADDPVQPLATFKVDLSDGSAAAMARFRPKTRYNVGLAERKGVSIVRGDLGDLPEFYRLLQETSSRDQFAVHDFRYYRLALEALGERASLLLARYAGEGIAGLMVAAFGDEAVYLYGASASRHRNVMPNYLLQAEAMRWAVARGCLRYDLWGIPTTTDGTEQSDGLYRFKSGFGGERVDYPGSFHFVYDPLRYRLWTAVLPTIRRLRRNRLIVDTLRLAQRGRSA